MTGGRVHGGRSNARVGATRGPDGHGGAFVGCIGRSDRTAALLAEYLGQFADGDAATGSVALGGDSLDVCRDEEDVTTLRASDADVDHRARLGIGVVRPGERRTDGGVAVGADGSSRVAVAGTVTDVGGPMDGGLSAGHPERRVTATVADFVARYREQGVTTERAFCTAVDRLDGPYALATVVEDEDAIYVAADGLPAAVGVAADAHVVSSDPASLWQYADEVARVPDGSVAVCWPADWMHVDA